MLFRSISNGIPIHILDTKKGEKVIFLLHGYLETLYIFSEFIELLDKNYRVIAIDLPGHGLSGSSKDVNSMDFSASIVADVLNICKVPEGSDVFVAGHSMGGYVAQSCIKLFPSIFKGLVLLNSTPFSDSPDKSNEREREIELINNLKLQQLASLSIPNTYAKENLRKFDDKILETVEIAETHDPQGIIASIRGLQQRQNNIEFLKTINNYIIILGDKDKYIVEDKMNEIKSLYPKHTIILQGVGHNCFIEAPEQTLLIIEQFIASL